MEISFVVLDPELGCTAFTVERITYTRTREGTTSRSTTVRAMGCIHPGTPEMIRLLPEEEREEQFIAIYTDYALSTGTSEGFGVPFIGPDRVHWGSRTWRVVRIRDWEMFGYYQAYAVLMRE